jgi:hypothetical protein
MMFHVVLKRDEEGWIVAECPALPDWISQGKTEPEALANIKGAIKGPSQPGFGPTAAPPEDQASLVVAV